ncbi:MAG: FG-GAP-like repeat-containing protein [Leptolyngbyaceae bacterium]|nr:FG-GAP-like repeat-containing protein [Leptolyngbyaceae bacterium]
MEPSTIPDWVGNTEAGEASLVPSVSGASTSPKTLLFIDASVDNLDYFLDGVDSRVEIVLLDPTQDGIVQISSALANYSDVSSLQIVSHGSTGALQLGNTTLNAATVGTYQDELLGWSQALSDGADILLFGCNVAEGTTGENFVGQLSGLTGADVAASDDLTGSATLGGDWDLEVATGRIEAEWAIAPSALSSYTGILNTLIAANQTNNTISLYETNGLGGFNPSTTLAIAGTGPSTVTLGDINGDGLEDILTTNGGSSNISLLINNGTGGFNSPQTFAVGAAPTQLAVADVNNDGRLDVLALKNTTNNFSVLLNNGTGGLTAAQNFATGTGPVGIGAADLNGDGNIDVFTANLNTTNVTVNLGNGAGSFSTPTATSTVGSLPVDMTTGDLNGDDRMDFVVANRSSRNVSVGLGNGTGGFTVTNYGAGGRPNAVILGDVNNDGALDIVSTHTTTQGSVLLNNRNGGFGGPTALEFGFIASDITFGNVNNDGNLDLLASNASANQIAVLLGNGNGGFTAQTPLAVTAAPSGLVFGNLSGSVTPPADTTAPVLQTAIANGSSLVLTYNEALDGASDPATGAYSVLVNGTQRTVNSVDANGTTVTLTLASAVTSSDTVALSYTVPGTNPVQDVAGNDAIALTTQSVTNTTLPPADTTAPVLQTAIANGSSLVLTYNEALDGASDPATGAYSVLVNGTQRTVNSVDANGTTVTLTLASAVTSSDTVVLSYTAPGTNPVQDLAGNDAIALTGQAVVNNTLPAPTGGTTPTLIVANQSSNSISLYTTNGSGGFNAPTTLAVGGSGPSTVTLGDINGDGLEDILTTNSGSSNISLLINNGVGGFNPAQTFSVSAAPTQLALADVNNDGRLDVLALQNATNSFAVLLNNGAGGFTAAQNFASGTGSVGIGAADLNGDGNIDVFTTNLNTTNVSVNLGNGTGSFGAPTATATVGSLPVDMTTGDLNGDGRMDFVVANRSSRNVSVGLGNGTGGFTVTNYGAAARPNVVILGDINNDGALDIATTNTNTQGSILLNNRNGGFSGPILVEFGFIASDITLGDVNNDGNLDLFASNTSASQVAMFLGNGNGGFTAQTPLTSAAPTSLAFASVIPDTAAPIFQGAVVNGSTLTLTYNETLDGASDPTGGVYTVTVNGVQRTVNSVDANGTTVTLTLASPVVGGETVAISYAVPGTNPIQDTVGNDAIAFTGQAVTNTSPVPDTTSPVLQTAVVNGSTLTLTYNEALDGASDPVGGAYTVTVNGVQRTVNSADANGTTVTLTLASPVVGGETVAISYAVPGTNPVQDVAGNDAAALTGQAVTNTSPAADTTSPVFQTGTVNGSTLTLTYNEALDGASDPAGGAYTVTVNGVQRTVNSADANGTTVTLTLASPVVNGETVAISYAVPGTNPIQDVAGNDAIALSNQTVTNITSSSNPGGGGSGSGLDSLVVANRFDGSISVFESDGAGGFSTQTTFSTGGNQPFAVAMADIDGDGLNDVVVANRGSGDIALLINDGAGGFLAPQLFAVGNQPTHIVLEDINGDGIPDAIVANNSSDNVSILLGNASGSFDAQTTIATGDGPWEVVVSDLNGDGNLDLTTVHFVSETVTVNLGDGQGNFAPTSGTYTVGNRPEGLVLEDVNNDNILDFVVSNASSRSVSVALGDGSGGFGAVTNYPTGSNTSSPLALGDVNNDGFADIVVGNSGSDNVSIMLNNGNGTFGAATFFNLGDSPFDIVLADINGDGNLDIMSADANSNTVTVLAGDGTGSFTLFATLAAGTAPVDMVFGSLSGNPGGGGSGAPTLVNAIVSGTTSHSTVKLIYSERLNGDIDPSASDYTVIVNGVVRAVSSVDVLPGTNAKGTNVILSMANPILLGDVVTVSYTPGATVVQDLEGNTAAGFANQAVANLRDFTLTYDFMTVADVFDFTEFGYTYDYGYLNDFSVLPSAAANQDGLDVRKNAADMTPEEIDAYINAILTLKDTTVLTDNGIEISLYDQFVAVHLASGDAIGRMAPDGSTMVNPAHNGPAFMAWHRLLLTEYENALQAVNPNVTLPFWDWTDLDATLNFVLEDNFMGPDPDISGDIQTGYFALSNGWAMRADLSDGRWLGVDATPEGIGRGSRIENPGTWRPGIENILQMDVFNLFANNVERGTGAHNNAHGYIGGIMANVSASPNDPIFWMLHSNVDRLWAEWQVDDHWGTSFYAGGVQNYGHGLNDPLFLWDNGAVPIAEDLRDLLVRAPGSTTWVTNGSGIVAGNFNNDGGTVSPGNSPGMLHIQGDYTQTASGELTVELAGTNPGVGFDVLKVDGTAKLDGELNLYFLGDFAPTEGTFTFLEADSIEGDFSEVNIFGLEAPIAYVLYKSEDGTTYNLKMLGLDEAGVSGLGVAQTANALLEDTDLTMYNPRFGRGLDMYIYGYSDMHGWDLNGEDALFDHSSHGTSDWYLSYDVDINEWIKLLADGAEIPEEYMSPMDHSGHDMDDMDDMDDDGMDHSGHDMDDMDDMDDDDMDHSGHDMDDMDDDDMDHSGHDMDDMDDDDMDHSGHDMDDCMDHSGHDMDDCMDHSGHDMGGNGSDRPTTALPFKIEGNLKHLDGTLDFGETYHRVKVKGNYVQHDDSDLFVKVGGKKPNKQYDVLKVRGTARLDGTLNIMFDEDYSPKDGQVFKFIQANRIKGDFDTINILGLDSDYHVETQIRNGKRWILTVTLPDGEEGDYDFSAKSTDREYSLDVSSYGVNTEEGGANFLDKLEEYLLNRDGAAFIDFLRTQEADSEGIDVQAILSLNPLGVEWWLNSFYSSDIKSITV